METALLLLIITVVLTLIFDYINGFHDAANAIATVVSTRVLRPITAVIYGATLNLVGALLGTEVATTIGKGLVESTTITIDTIICTVIAGITWNLITWYKGLPASSSHALIGSLLGATYFSNHGGSGSVMWDSVINKILIPMVASPIVGFGAGFLIMMILSWMVFRVSLGRINRVFSRLQILSAGFMALEHGRNDAQKSMGIIALAIVLTYPHQEFMIPLWVKLSCAAVMALGTLSGGWRVIRTLGSKLIKLQPIHGFAAETAGALAIMSASHMGVPVSTTQVITSSIMGVGATRGLSAVRWSIVGNILWAWVLTIPLTFCFAGLLTWLYQLVK